MRNRHSLQEVIQQGCVGDLINKRELGGISTVKDKIKTMQKVSDNDPLQLNEVKCRLFAGDEEADESLLRSESAENGNLGDTVFMQGINHTTFDDIVINTCKVVSNNLTHGVNASSEAKQTNIHSEGFKVFQNLNLKEAHPIGVGKSIKVNFDEQPSSEAIDLEEDREVDIFFNTCITSPQIVNLNNPEVGEKVHNMKRFKYQKMLPLLMSTNWWQASRDEESANIC